MNPQIYRQPDGKWHAVAPIPIIGSTPMGASITVVREIVDERPFRDEAYRRIARTLAPVARQLGVIGATPGSEPHQRLWNAVQVARQAAAVEVDQKVREQLMGKIGNAIQHAINTTKQVQSSHRGMWSNAVATNLQPPQRAMMRAPVTQTSPNATNYAAVLVRRMEQGDHNAYSEVLALANRTLQKNPEARQIMIEVIRASAISPAGAVLRRLFLPHPPLQRFAVVLDRQAALSRQQPMSR